MEKIYSLLWIDVENCGLMIWFMVDAEKQFYKNDYSNQHAEKLSFFFSVPCLK